MEAQARQSKYANENRKEVTFKVGDKVWLSTKHLNKRGRAEKLLPLYIGPYEITHIINPVAYRLALPASLRIHKVFHVSQLKRCIDQPDLFPHRDQVIRPPPEEINEQGEELYEVERVISKRTRRLRGRNITEYLVLWKGYPEWEKSWEPASGLRRAQEAIQAYNSQQQQQSSHLRRS
jgi:hypothetical protein